MESEINARRACSFQITSEDGDTLSGRGTLVRIASSEGVSRLVIEFNGPQQEGI